MRETTVCRAAVSLGILLSSAAPAWAWHEEGHQAAARAALGALRDEGMPPFFLAGAGQIAHCAVDPDCFTRPIGPPNLHDAESCERALSKATPRVATSLRCCSREAAALLILARAVSCTLRAAVRC